MDTLDSKETKDYHGMLDYHYFAAWMGILLSALWSRNITNAIVLMNNTKYHKKFHKDGPRKNEKKIGIQNAWTEYVIAFDLPNTKGLR